MTITSRSVEDPAIALFAYNRPLHLEACLASLRRNPESVRTLLYFFLDGPRNSDDAILVERVRSIARTAQGFREVRRVQRDDNWGLSRNIIDGVTQVLAEHESVIVVEDDLVVSSGFLSYLSHALALYRQSPEVFSVSAYNYPRKLFRLPNGYPYDTFFVMRHMCWGWGTWRDRWERADWNVTDFPLLSRSDSFWRSFREGGLDLPAALFEQVSGRLDSWAIRWTYAHFAHHAVCLVPADSFVNNAGVDGSGTHMRSSNRYFHPILNEKGVTRFPPLVYVDPVIARRYKTAERSALATRAAQMFLGMFRRPTSRERAPVPSSRKQIERHRKNKP